MVKFSGVSFNDEVFAAVEERRGLIPRSTFINEILRQALGIGGDREKHHP